MKLRNRKTGEIRDVESLGHEKSLRDKYGPQITLSWNTDYENLGECRTYTSLAELNSEWEDAPEEPKGYWYISAYGNLAKTDVMTDLHRGAEEIGNLFETKEEAEKAVERLRAWKRLKDKGFGFTAWKNGILLDETIAGQVRYEFPIDNKDDIEKDLDICFGGEE